ncbi:DUF1330 domain-containing protein [Kluyvera intermedia]|uniref:DUF1330 domain-containing protein n=1 Tax=Kluyvera intermedia TaxID=61648 RepID=UPI00242ECE36|nr:DUF1330 domain-containing protein [Kluyvera intermedia]WEJ85043.1 MAG: DUF1330 domain-containing protein [Kluyvera intermedia]
MHKTSLLRVMLLSVFTCTTASVLGQETTLPQVAPAPKPAFMVAEFKLNNPEAIKPYRDQVEATFKSFSGRFVARGGTVDVKEGAAPNGWVVITRFDSMEQARAWYDSAAYRAILPVRQNAGVSRVYFVEGLEESLAD